MWIQKDTRKQLFLLKNQYFFLLIIGVSLFNYYKCHFVNLFMLYPRELNWLNLWPILFILIIFLVAELTQYCLIKCSSVHLLVFLKEVGHIDKICGITNPFWWSQYRSHTFETFLSIWHENKKKKYTKRFTHTFQSQSINYCFRHVGYWFLLLAILTVNMVTQWCCLW